MKKQNSVCFFKVLPALVILAFLCTKAVTQSTPNQATPSFWNLKNFTELNFQLFYGWSSDYTRIFFRFVGVNQGWIGLAFGSTLVNTDMLIINQSGTIPSAQHYYSTSASAVPQLASSQGWRWEGGQFTSATGQWDISVSRLATPPASQQDTAITPAPSPIIFGVSSAQTVTSNFVNSHTYLGVVFSQSGPICDSYCLTCSGPLINECLSCATGTVLYNQYCITNSPIFWNRLIASKQVLGFYVDYGFDEFYNYIFFRFYGLYSGYVGLGFGTAVPNTDFIVIQQPASTLQVYDCYGAQGNVLQVDTQQNVVYVSGSILQSTPNAWNDVVVMRALNTQAPSQDSILVVNQSTPVMLLFGPSENYTQTYAQSEVYQSLYLSGIEICDASCLTCQGPASTDCLTCATAYVFLQSTGQCLQCYSGCSACSGSLQNQCTACISPLYLYNNTCILCDPTCSSCYGTTASSCLSCSSSSEVVYFGTCINPYPQFWNQLLVSGSFYLYYGFDTKNQYVYMKFYGNSNGWIGLAFAATLVNADMIMIYMSNGQAKVVDTWSTGPSSQTIDAIQNMLYLRGQRDSLGNWDIDVVRLVNTGDQNQDTIIPLNTKMPLTFTFGPNDNIDIQYSIIVQLSNQIFNTTRFVTCSTSCQTCLGPTASQCASCASPLVLDNAQCVSCYLTCATCIGAGSNQCLTCKSPYYLNQSSCVSQVQPICHPSCLTCTDSKISSCTSCSATGRKFFQGYCLLLSPSYWNLPGADSTLTLYYGFDSKNSDFIYFRIFGNYQGYIGVGFGQKMSAGMDCFMIYYVNSQVVVTDRYATGYYEPIIDPDAQNIVLIQGGRDVNGNWDVTVAKRMLTSDPYDTQIYLNLTYPLSIVASTSDNTATVHSYLQLLGPFKFQTQQICNSNCGAAGCIGPQAYQCINTTLSTRGGLIISTLLTIQHGLLLLPSIAMLFSYLLLCVLTY